VHVKTVTNSGVLSGSGNRQDDEEAAAETTGFEVITGGEGNDTITGGTGDDYAYRRHWKRHDYRQYFCD
jgi:Ca2+-binding RTX toxin-like protein